ncbi:hypothetical protein BKP37_12800 [Anaerobacillus alkalilacustris]|uniref:YopX protein domain-containing protein n=1 Tax=Anaerobacillus alkalilacustris TaxID=393763 RepID=A0A1S2LMM2_9BACI|nr:YopX family protein [Anaerobacillus alkalilacustris]OIJ12675.1 hypothetical protein BKP37_12800 [Anaerobacillus alkalilacustris]
MREIKFRFFRTKAKEMVYGFKGCSLTYVLDLWEKEKHVSYPMQYTGLKDNNGKEIYEGDILRLKAHQDFFVDFYESSFVAKSTNKVQRINWLPSALWEIISMGYEVVGNKYENPEMLNE